MNQQFALKAVVLAATLVFAQASQAINIESKSAVLYFNADSSIFGSPATTVEPWNLVNGSSSVLAFCIDPLTWGIPSVTNYGASSYAPSELVRNLYESSYSQIFVGGVYNENKAAAFQLALWSVTNPANSVVLAETGGVFDHNDEISHDANTWVQAAKDYQFNGAAQYSYTEYKSLDHSSQTVLTVSAVPEPESWAMMMVGVGLVGFMGRRKSKKSEQFAA
ncbi:PEPxxWA-CTERM sorting domain-containing protein [Duganella sp. FT109W]|uniref:PEPxxWA-CTERM sorting domain-containing protein n=1 Tax=Duganella margarita TaxID=2692170 RepID=A0ABW9WHJ0_9BURK|nr:PEPxxWA-CTERM sorting domain-containing protein [Duganella margarita]MYN40260.1 PEPxxWA-CTERM sorting domain-containing protein [Duganella margarita]